MQNDSIASGLWHAAASLPRLIGSGEDAAAKMMPTKVGNSGLANSANCSFERKYI